MIETLDVKHKISKKRSRTPSTGEYDRWAIAAGQRRIETYDGQLGKRVSAREVYAETGFDVDAVSFAFSAARPAGNLGTKNDGEFA